MTRLRKRWHHWGRIHWYLGTHGNRDGRRVRFDRHDLDTHMRRNRIEKWAS